MENLNAEQVKKSLEYWVEKYRSKYYTNHAKDALALINSQEQKIFELENRLKECENGYEGTLFLDRCKLHDAEEKVKELSEENASLNASYTELERKCASLNDENERLRAEASPIGNHFHHHRPKRNDERRKLWKKSE